MAYVIMALEVLQMVMGLLVNSLSFYYYREQIKYNKL